MPYYIYKVRDAGAAGLVKHLSRVDSFDKFREAKHAVRELRAQCDGGDSGYLKIIFAESELQAEELLQEKRGKPILMEHEK